jgi:fatty acid desaturase
MLPDEFERKIGASASELYAIVADLARARAAIYWADLLATCTVAYGAFWAANVVARSVWLDAACLVLSGAAMYRATLFTHELAHLPRRAWPQFRVAWNVLCGVPLLVPSFLYEIHMAHHERGSYGTAADGEYRAFATAPRIEAVASVAASLLAVPALVVRFLVLAPLGWLLPPLRRRVLAKLSALVIDFRSARELPHALPARWAVQEAACFAWCACLLLLVAADHLALGVLLQAYAVVTMAVFMNALRVLCAHRYRRGGTPSAFVDQVLDSNNFPSGAAWLWAPLGLRYHAVHHLFPGLPYHALGEAHRRLRHALPANSAFRATDRQSFLTGLHDVLGRRGSSMEAVHEG